MRRRAGGLSRDGTLSLTRLLDGLVHFSVLAFAAWTLVFDLGVALRLRTSLLLVIWAVCVALIVTVIARRASVATIAAAPAGAAPAGQAPRAPGRWTASARWVAAAGVALAAGAGAVAGLRRLGLPWLWVPLAGLASVAAAWWLLRGDLARSAAPVPHRESWPGPVLAAGTGAAAAVFSLFMVRPTPDDVYYVSRSVWTAEHGQIPVRDILFTSQAIKPISGEPPISSIEVLDGALARVLGLPAATVVYGISLPVMTFISVWAVWMLIRRWAPARHPWCFLVAVVYLAWTGGAASFGAFHLGTMWEGKAAFVAVMVPLLYAYLTDWAERGTMRSLALVAAAGVAAAGLSSAAVYVVPLITLAAAVPLLAGRMVKAALGTALASVYPLAAGLVVAAGHPAAHMAVPAFTAPTVWAWIMKTGLVGAIGGAALWMAPWLARRRVPALITAGIAGLAAVLLMPGLVGLLGAKIGIMPVIWRVLWLVPAPVLTGLLAAVPLPGPARFRVARRAWPVIPTAAVSVALAVTGVPVWSHENGVTVAARPSWKIDGDRLRVTRDIVRADRRPGYILSTWRLMETVPLLTSRVRVVNPRSYYLTILPSVSAQFVRDRVWLTALADGGLPRPAMAGLRGALSRVPVGYACIPYWRTAVIGLLYQAGFTRAPRFGVFQCLQRQDPP
jgi:hypothetical protein